MQPIVPTIHPRETSPQVANLQDALLALLARDKIWRVDASNRPTPEELEKLSVDIRRERAGPTGPTFGKATRQLVVYFQVHQGLGDGGVVEDTTAAKLNELLTSIGAFNEDTSLIVRGTVKTADDQPISGAIVRAFDRDLRNLQQCGKAVLGTRKEDGSVDRYRNIRLFSHVGDEWIMEFWYNYEITGV